ncbi:MAG TPA: enoyl-CoA hydratase-related protein, partial [Pseudonocardia sp.]
MTSTVQTERHGAVLLVRLNRPDQLNAYNLDMLDDLVRTYDEADADNDVRAIVVTGNGRAFCAGADLSSGGDTFNRGDDAEHRDSGGVLNLRTFELSKPIIAAINGPAVG